MLNFFLLLVRHGLAIGGAYLAAHGIESSSTQGIVCGLILAAVPWIWSWIAKMLQFDATWNLDPTLGEKLRTGLASLVSQGITFASAYYAVDANDPSALCIAAINALASHYGVHQQIAHQAPLEVATAIRALMACLFILSLSSCAGVMAWLASPAGQVTIGLAELGVKEAIAHGKISEGDVVTIKQATAIVTNQTTPTKEKVFKLADLGLDAAVAKGVVQPGDSVLIQEATAIIQSAVVPAVPSAKQPVNVSPKNPTPAPITLQEPDCLRLVIPDYGVRVAAVLTHY